MRVHHAIAIAAVILAGFGLTLFFLPFPAAEADAGVNRGVSVHISQMQENIKNLPAAKVHDMTFIFSEGD
jgi:predicted acyltransferase